MPIQRRTQFSIIFFAIAGLSFVGVVVAAAGGAAPTTKLGLVVLMLITLSAGIFMRAWSFRPEEVKPPTPLAKLLPPRRRASTKDRSGLEPDIRR